MFDNAIIEKGVWVKSTKKMVTNLNYSVDLNLILSFFVKISIKEQKSSRHLFQLLQIISTHVHFNTRLNFGIKL